MQDNKMIEYKSSWISKIKEFFKSIFHKNEEKVSNTESTVKGKNKKEEFFEQLHQEKSNTEKMADIREKVKKIEEDENYLQELSINELQEINKYYDKIIEENNNMIMKLKKTA